MNYTEDLENTDKVYLGAFLAEKIQELIGLCNSDEVKNIFTFDHDRKRSEYQQILAFVKYTFLDVKQTEFVKFLKDNGRGKFSGGVAQMLQYDIPDPNDGKDIFV